MDCEICDIVPPETCKICIKNAQLVFNQPYNKYKTRVTEEYDNDGKLIKKTTEEI